MSFAVSLLATLALKRGLGGLSFTWQLFNFQTEQNTLSLIWNYPLKMHPLFPKISLNIFLLYLFRIRGAICTPVLRKIFQKNLSLHLYKDPFGAIFYAQNLSKLKIIFWTLNFLKLLVSYQSDFLHLID